MDDKYYDQLLNGVAYHLKENQREISWRPSNFTNVRFPITWANIFVDCKKCEQSIGMKLQSDENMGKINDEEAAELFRSNGWEIDLYTKPKVILCPKCRNGGKENDRIPQV